MTDNDWSRVPADEPEPAYPASSPRFDLFAEILRRDALEEADGDAELADPLNHWEGKP